MRDWFGRAPTATHWCGKTGPTGASHCATPCSGPHPFFSKSKKSEREEENDNCIGGLRNPWKAVTRNQGLATAGAAVWDIFKEVVQAHPESMIIADTVGTSAAKEPPDEAVHLYRSKMCEAFQLKAARLVALPSHGKVSPIQGDILQAWLGSAGDEEIHL